jgi:hypothetical protein
MDKKIFTFVAAAVFSFVFLPAISTAACNQVSGKTYYTDGVSYFSDASCRDEMTAAQIDAAGVGYISTGDANCHYSLTKELYTDGMAFFTNNKCTSEAEDGQTVAAPTAAAAVAQTTVAAPTSAVSATQYAQMTQRIVTLENQVKVLMSIISQVLTLLAQK